MSCDPILVLQLRRLGDLILTFPLLVELNRRYPQNPIWVAAEPKFFKGLMPFAPESTFLPPEHLNVLAGRKFKGIINLSSNTNAIQCAGLAEAEWKLGPVLKNKSTYINGFWQLYRAALTRNNRHNLFHWSDLDRLDLGFPLTPVETARKISPKSGKIGLFIGASDAAKRPEPEFWVALARLLLKKGKIPVLLGGSAEQEEGELIAKKVPLINFCGKTTLTQLVSIFDNLELLVTPDTGPMHLADWVGAKVLNLSMGNVQAWETGPASSGQWIAQTSSSCVGCWECSRDQLYCKKAFSPLHVANLILALAQGNVQLLQHTGLSRLQIWQTGRLKNGLYNLTAQNLSVQNARYVLDRFWQKAFLHFFYQEDNLPDKISLETGVQTDLQKEALHLKERFPALTNQLKSGLLNLAYKLVKNPLDFANDELWQKTAPHTRLLAGFTQMQLQNEDFSKSAQKSGLQRISRVLELL